MGDSYFFKHPDGSLTELVEKPSGRCAWQVIGRSPCGKEATHGTMLRNGIYYLCKYHAGVARRDGWKGVQLLKNTPIVGPGG